MLVRLLEATPKLKGRSVSQITTETLYDVANTVKAAESTSVKVYRFDNLLGSGDHHNLAHDLNLTRKRIKNIQRQMNTPTTELE